MNQIPVPAACEFPSFFEQSVHAHSSAGLAGTVTTPIQNRNDSSRRILVVDDDRSVRQFCADALIGSGFQVDTAEDAVAGWQALQANSYHLLLTDNKMPMISSMELVKKLRSARMDLQVVLASSVIPTEEIDRDSSLQFAATLLKPFTIAELLDTVDRALRMGDCSNRSGISFRP